MSGLAFRREGLLRPVFRRGFSFAFYPHMRQEMCFLNISMAGIDHSMAGIDIRQRFSLAKSRQQQILQALFHMEMVEGAVLLSTCNRTEIYLSCREGFSPDPFALFCQAANLPFEDCQGLYKVRRGEECFDHLCLLGSGALSQIWGEDQIITQVKNAITLAREEHCADSLLEVFFRTAVTAAKKIKTTLRFTRSEASVATKTLEILQNAPDAPRNVLVIGNGEIGRLVCSRLLEQGFSVSMTLRQYKHGQIQVPEGAESFDYALRYQEMPRFDALVSATSSPHYTVDWAEFSRLAKAPRYLIDLAVPRDIDPACGEKAALYNIDTLGREEFTRERAVLLQQAQEIVEKYRQDLHKWESYRAQRVSGC